ncbi:very short patch repair endonuclease [Knoellia sp. Soil729]|uniref:very short patch repair endonuclease n=1 Tax=Knoellia sp. Soil729 TaxID=1736394 RepID=UPI0009E912E9|nr:very short patch repair endonuclease [Knoellia sp. Soil729]
MVKARPQPSSERVRLRFRRQKTRDTRPEMALRRELFRRGMRYRVNYPVPGLPRRTIDITFPRQRLAIFVDGCFWHGCPIHGVPPKANAEWWREKIDRNRVRDSETTQLLTEHAWRVLRVWEHDVRNNLLVVAGSVEQALSDLVSPKAASQPIPNRKGGL